MQSAFGKRYKRLHVNVFLWYAFTCKRLQHLPKGWYNFRNGGTHCDWPELNPNPNPMRCLTLP